MKYLWIAGAVVVAAALVLALAKWRTTRNMLAPTIVGAMGAFLLVGGWLFVIDSTVAKNEAIKTGGLAGGSVIALYALWLNDRRRRTEEARQQVETDRQKLENQRAEHDRTRVADERFARAIELLGHEADQVRVGALHALAGLAKSREEYAQTVLDILCSYLRRTFDEEHKDSALEREVRLTAQELISDLLPRVGQVDAPHYDLNLTNANLGYFDLEDRQVGKLTLRSAKFNNSNAFHHAVFHGQVYFTGAVNHGRLYLHDSVFHGRAGFGNFVSNGPVDFHDSEFRSSSKFAHGQYVGGLSLRGAKFSVAPEVEVLTVHRSASNALPPNWTVDEAGKVTVT